MADGHTSTFLYRLLGGIERGWVTGPASDVGYYFVGIDTMNTITLTRTEFDALPTPPTAAPKPKKGVRWKHFFHGHWFVAEYIEVATDVLGIEFREVVIEEEAR